MSKNFEEEFKAYAVEDIPDLWSRIEPALADKAPSSKEEIKEEIKETVKEEKELSVEKQAGAPKRKRSARKVFAVMVPSLCAAALILLLLPMFLFPALRNKGNSGIGPSSAGGANCDNSTSVNFRPSAGMATQDAAESMEEAAGDEGIEETNATITAGYGENSKDSGTSGATMNGYAPNGESDKKESDAEIASVKVRAQVITVRKEELGWVCEIELLEPLSENFPFQAGLGETIEAEFHGTAEEAPTVGEEYEVNLEYREEAEIPIILTYAEE